MSFSEIDRRRKCKPMDGQNKKKGITVPRLLRQAIIQDYLSGRKSSYMLSIEHGVDQKNISKMVHHYQQKNGIILAESITVPIMERKKKQQE
ncbi:hypothetical protein JGH11_13160 [Dysgonomonas sp. Marseille-P4677]|uniref:hypothetical protein n=1 Tax=Dysgonomonas sp. Marseille-P4677 TaxID=2364790 RepID=UPI0019124190|nr:hypothetical protein [Dysgonomonas sp. Marseille-P4677]MBK5721822.1 hypothetical protein [Dysgonomonas sp. Marseille-P4677]